MDAYYQFQLKPWDVAAGVVILEEAGGRVTTTDGAAFSVFDRSLLATNDALYEKVGWDARCWWRCVRAWSLDAERGHARGRARA